MQLMNNADDLLTGDQPGALILPLSTFVHGTLQKITVIKIDAHIVPATMAAIRIEYAPRCIELT